MAKKKYRLTWSRQPNEQGLASVCQGPRGAVLKVSGVRVGRVYANSVGFHDYNGWYWVARHGGAGDDPTIPEIPIKNTCETPTKELEVAKAECEAYVRGTLDKA